MVGGGPIGDLTPDDMARSMIGAEELAGQPPRTGEIGAKRLEIRDLAVSDDAGQPAKSARRRGVWCHKGRNAPPQIFLPAGRAAAQRLRRQDERRRKSRLLAFRSLAPGERRIAQYRVRTRSPDTPLAALSGGNVQRTVLARELDGGAEVMIAANPCFGLDFSAVAQIHAEIVAARNRGAAILLVSSDLDEILEIADRLVVMFNGRVVHEAQVADADLTEIGRHMAGH
jgi:general nucleoside transport system ATP-binding protein